MTIRELLEQDVRRYGDRNALLWNEDKVWKRRTWREFLARVRDLAEGYGTRFGLKPRVENTAIILGNSPAWLESYLAQSGAGVSVVPMDPKLHEAEMEYILNDAGAVVITTDKAHLKMMMSLVPKVKSLRGIVVVDGVISEGQRIGDVDVVGFEKLRVSGGGAWYDAHVATEQDVASIIYTSGTTGKPKGAMITHRNFVADAEGALAIFDAHPELSPDDSFLIVLPLFHAFSFTANFVVTLVTGSEMYFVESLRTVGRDIHDLKPTVICAVPLLAEKLYDKIQEGLAKSKVARFLMAIGLRGPVMHMVYLKLGGKLRYMVTGGAPCPKPVLECFRKLHVNFLEGYGLTECAPIVSVTDSSSRKIGTIGRPCTGVEVRLADRNEQGVGELQVKGPIVMKGYFHNEKATKESFDGEWFMTGDLASMDEEGYLTIRGRKKALIVNREGKNIYPEEVENRIGADPVVADCVVVGYITGGVPGEKVGCVVHPNMDLLKEMNGGVELTWEEAVKAAQDRVHAQCHDFADYKRVRKVVVSREPLVRTSIQKVKRVVYKGTLDE